MRSSPQPASEDSVQPISQSCGDVVRRGRNPPRSRAASPGSRLRGRDRRPCRTRVVEGLARDRAAEVRDRQAEVPFAAEVAFLRDDRRSLRGAVREADDHALDSRLTVEDANAAIDRVGEDRGQARLVLADAGCGDDLVVGRAFGRHLERLDHLGRGLGVRLPAHAGQRCPVVGDRDLRRYGASRNQ